MSRKLPQQKTKSARQCPLRKIKPSSRSATTSHTKDVTAPPEIRGSRKPKGKKTIPVTDLIKKLDGRATHLGRVRFEAALRAEGVMTNEMTLLAYSITDGKFDGVIFRPTSLEGYSAGTISLLMLNVAEDGSLQKFTPFQLQLATPWSEEMQMIADCDKMLAAMQGWDMFVFSELVMLDVFLNIINWARKREHLIVNDELYFMPGPDIWEMEEIDEEEETP